MLAQQESVVQLMSLYEAARSEGPEFKQGAGNNLKPLHQECKTGKARLKGDRYRDNRLRVEHTPKAFRLFKTYFF